jgi:uncharacterized membrane-anchored protein
MTEEQLRSLIRELIDEIIKEYSGSGAVGAYNTPMAFAKSEKDWEKLNKNRKYAQ